MSTLLAAYTDSTAVSDYAKANVAACIKAGLVTGTSVTTLSPKEYSTNFSETVQFLAKKYVFLLAMGGAL